MINSVDPSIKIKMIFRRSWVFFRCLGKKRQNLGEFFEQFDRLIDTIDSVCTNGSMAIGQRRFLKSIVDTINQK
jgi:hypothetical protein